MNTGETCCSKRLGIIEHSRFQAALDRFGHGRLLRVEAINPHKFGQNVFLTSDRGEFVLRGRPHFPWQLPKEKFFTDLLHERSAVPVAWPYELEPDPGLFGWPYALMPKLPGRQLSDPAVVRSLSPADRIEIAALAGATLATLKAVDYPFAGDFALASGGIAPFAEEHAAWVEGRISESIREARKVNCSMTRAEEEWLTGICASARPALAGEFTPVFVMQDYREGNLAVEQRAGEWQVTGLFDFMEPYFSDGEIDLCRPFACYLEEGRPELAQAFLRGYLARRALRPGYRERYPAYVLLDRLMLWNFARRFGGLEQELTLRGWLEKYLDTGVFAGLA